ncbi:MAG: 4Fe-4S dicluster domain-containing protein [Candidatus Helarchaeota archaeon]|nr:4Fe-4S dicluster domain-containing protein [Candidatus Helarchaeota archaeon]
MAVTIDFNFRNEIIRSKFSLSYCFQCGTCSGACPVALMTKGAYNPRVLIEQSILGLKERLIESQEPNVWLCSTCQLCVELCPQDVNLTEIFNLIKNKCVKIGNYPEGYKAQGITILENGMAVPFSPAILRRRDQLSIPKLKMAEVSEIQTILKETEFDKKIKYDWMANNKNTSQKVQQSKNIETTT